jgi:flavin reductase (DIM6/NTAB) family NADH-FMN oxidoreductase RutF
MKTSIGAKTIVFPTPVFLVCAYDTNGRPNVMTAAWGGICCSSPPCVAVSLRKATYTYDCIMSRKAFTVNIPAEKQVNEADFFGLVSGKRVDKFALAGMTAVKSDVVDAPYIEECPLVVECETVNVTDLGLHTQFVGKVIDIKAEESTIVDNTVDSRRFKPFWFDPARRVYVGMGEELGKAFSMGKTFGGPSEEGE